MGRRLGNAGCGLRDPHSRWLAVASFAKAAGQMCQCRRAIDLVRVVRPLTELRQVNEVDAQQDGERAGRPQAQHEDRVGEVMPMEVHDVPCGLNDCIVRKPWRDLAKATR